MTRPGVAAAAASSPEIRRSATTTTALTAEQRAWLGRKSDLFMRLRALAPPLFAGKRPLPLAIGIYQAIAERLELSTEDDRQTLRVVLRETATRKAYLKALMAPNAQRHDLAGAPVEAVSEAHKRAAARALKKLQKAL